MAGTPKASGFDITGGVHIDTQRYGPHADLNDAKGAVGASARFLGLTVGITEGSSTVEYWWKDGTADSDLILKEGDQPVALSGSTPFTLSMSGKVSAKRTLSLAADATLNCDDLNDYNEITVIVTTTADDLTLTVATTDSISGSAKTEGNSTIYLATQGKYKVSIMFDGTDLITEYKSYQ